jgi:DNA polymerase
MEEMLADFHRLTNLGISPTQRDKLLHWLVENGIELKDLRKGTIDQTLKKPLSDDIRRILRIRKEFVASSLAKLDKVLVQSDKAGRARGLLQYHGARTGRWTGRGIQPQNLPRPLIKVKSFEIETLVAQIKSGDRKALEARGDPIDVLVSSLRHIVVARDGALLAVGDFSMIEACILLALAGQRDKCELIRAGKDPYRDMGVLLYGLAGDVRDVFLSADKEDMTVEQEKWRAAGKVGVLGPGFGASGEGVHRQYPYLDLETCCRAVATYRDGWAPLVKGLWGNLRANAHGALRQPGKVFKTSCGVEYLFDNTVRRSVLICRLLNGKELFYHEPKLENDPKYNKPTIYYSTLKDHHWRRDKAWHGTLTENVVSGLARELLVDAMFRLEKHGYRVVLSIHDELVVEGVDLTKELTETIMSEPPPWAAAIDVPVAVEAWVGKRYRK